MLHWYSRSINFQNWKLQFQKLETFNNALDMYRRKFKKEEQPSKWSFFYADQTTLAYYSTHLPLSLALPIELQEQ